MNYYHYLFRMGEEEKRKQQQQGSELGGKAAERRVLVEWFVLGLIFPGFRSAGQTKQDVRGFPQFLLFENFSATFFAAFSGPNKSKEKKKKKIHS